MKHFLIYFLILFSFLNCESTDNIKSKPKSKYKVNIPFTKHGELYINDLQFDIEFAKTDTEKAQGLMYRDSLRENNAMLFLDTEESMRYFYMKNTRIYLDIIFIDKNMKIVHIHKNAIPYDLTSIPSLYPAQYVLEVRGGLTDKLNIKIGDKIKYKEILQEK